ncbi:MAG: nuclear transport factor 2 family protein [Deltaproteobacteria bacterium]|nr:nuclear transport factor 2 family protein [Deltaproteobacteria bacterium]
MVSSPKDIPAAFASAFNRKDVEALLALYSDDALLVADGTAEVPRSGLRAALEGFLGLPGPITMSLRRAVVQGETAVVIAEWSLPNGVTGTTSDVVRREPDGGWRYVIDAPFGIRS